MTEPIKQPELFVVRHYGDDEKPCIKGNGFDGLTIGEDREEAEQFVAWVNARLAVEQNTAELRAEVERLRADAERYRHLCEYQRWTPEIEAAFDCSPKVLIDEAIDNSIKAMKEPTP
jgi:hypothetical protein